MAGVLPALNVSAAQVADPAAQRQLLRLIQFMPPFLGAMTADPDTTSWGAEMEGAFWWNLTVHAFKHWDGSSIVSGL